MLWGPVPSTEPLLPLSLAGCRSPLLTADCPSAPLPTGVGAVGPQGAGQHTAHGALKEFFPSWPLGAEMLQLGKRLPGGR